MKKIIVSILFLGSALPVIGMDKLADPKSGKTSLNYTIEERNAVARDIAASLAPFPKDIQTLIVQYRGDDIGSSITIDQRTNFNGVSFDTSSKRLYASIHNNPELCIWSLPQLIKVFNDDATVFAQFMPLTRGKKQALILRPEGCLITADLVDYKAGRGGSIVLVKRDPFYARFINKALGIDIPAINRVVASKKSVKRTS